MPSLPMPRRRHVPDHTQRDGEASVPQEQAIGKGAVAARLLTHSHRAIPRPETVIQASLAQKLLHGWMQNRHQTLFPLVLNFRNLSADEKTLIIEAMAVALQAGESAGLAAGRAETWLLSVGGDAQDVAALAQSRTAPCRIGEVAAALRAAGLAAQAYAAAVGTLSRRLTVNRRFHDYLAARLGLADEVARGMNRRYGA